MASISNQKNIESLIEAIKVVFTGFLQEQQAQSVKGKIKIDDIIQAFQADEVQTKLIDAIQNNIPKATRKASKNTPKDPNAPKRPKSNYLFFCEDKRAKVKEHYPNLKTTEITSKLGEIWKALSDKDKATYMEKAEKAKESYKEKMKSYVAPSDEELVELSKKGKKGDKRPKDPNAPKRPKSSYLFFCENKRDLVKEAEPELKPTEVTSKLGQLWKALKDKQKQKYIKLADEAKESYNEKMKSYVRPSEEKLADSKPKRRGSSKSSKGKESGAPKRPMTAFFFFSRDKREEVKNDNPELKGTDINKELGRMWKDDFADSESRSIWVDQAEKEKERYKKEMESFKESQKPVEEDSSADDEKKKKTKQNKMESKESQKPVEEDSSADDEKKKKTKHNKMESKESQKPVEEDSSADDKKEEKIKKNSKNNSKPDDSDSDFSELDDE